MKVILFVWTIISAGSGTSYAIKWEAKGWRPFGEFSSVEKCEAAAQSLGYKAAEFRCATK